MIYTESPLISIVIPVYNVEDYLHECLDSAINQTLNNIEIICVNDGSTDGSLEILREYAVKDNRIAIIDKSNAGYGHSMNCGIDKAKGKYLAILESDDYIKEDMCSKLYETAESIDHKADYILSDAIKFCTETDHIVTKRIACAKGDQYHRLINPLQEKNITKNRIMHWAGIYRMDFLRRYNIRFHESKGASYQDNGFWFQTIFHAEYVYFLKDAFYMYRTDRYDSSINSEAFEKLFCIFSEYNFIYNIMNQYPDKKNDYLSIYILRYFTSLMYHLNRIILEQKLIFLKKFQAVMQEYKNKGELDATLLEPEKMEILQEIINDPEGYFFLRFMSEKEKSLSESLSKQYQEFINIRRNMLILSTKEIQAKRAHPKVSVIIPVYNAETYLAECLTTVRNQTLRDIEIICIDDGSTDRSMAILSTFAMADSRIVLHTQINSGAGIARNEGLRLAQGEFVAFMDADDWYPNREVLETLYYNAIKQNVDICGGRLIIYKDGLYKTASDGSFDKDDIIEYTDYQYDYGYYNYIYKLDMLKKNSIYFPSYRRYQDPPFFVNAMIAAGRFYAMNDISYCYRYGHQNIEWTIDKLADLIKGIIDNLNISREHKLDILHYKCVMRLDNDYKKRILDNFNNDLYILRLLFIAENSIDVELLKKVKPDIPDCFRLEVIREAFEIIHHQSTKDKPKKRLCIGIVFSKIGRTISLFPRMINNFINIAKKDSLLSAIKKTRNKIRKSFKRQ